MDLKNSSVELQILEIFNRMFDTQFVDLNIDRSSMPEWDSMKHVELILKLQKHFKIKFAPIEITQTKNLNELKMTVIKLTNER